MLKISNITQKWVEVVKPFTGDYSVKLTATNIAKLSNVPQQTVSRILNSLVKLNLIDYVIQGKNKLFYFDEEKITTSSVLTIVEEIKAIDFGINFKESLILNKLAGCCEGIILFGSYANGKVKKDSDFDVALFGKCDKNKLDVIKKTSPVEIHEQIIGYSELKKLIKNKHPLALEIFDNHVLFGDVSRIVNLFLEIKNG